MIARALSNLLRGRREGAASTVNLGHLRDPALTKLFGVGPTSRAGVRVDADAVLGIPAVLRGVEIISNATMKVRPLIYKRTPDGGGSDDKERDRDHKNWRVVTRRANPLMSAGYFRKTLTAWSILRGNGLGYLVRRGDGSIVEMLPLPPDRSGMAIFRNGVRQGAGTTPAVGDVVQYWTNVGGEIRRLDPADVIHIKGFSPNGYWGLDLVEACCETFGVSIAARNFSSSFFGNGALGSGIVFMPPGMKEETKKDFAKKLRDSSEGLGRAHRLLILEDSAKYQPMTIEPEKAALIGVLAAQRVDLAAVIGIQPHKVGDSSRVAYNSLEQSNQEHLDDDLDPRLQIWEDELEEKCLTEREKNEETHLIEFNRKALVRVNLQARTARHQFERTHGLASANDILRQENQRPLGPVGDTLMVPANMTILSPDGLPILRGQAAPDPPAAPASSGAAALAEELALHEVERLATRTTAEAVRRAKQGGAAFLGYLDELATRSHGPAGIADLLEATSGRLRAGLAAYVESPYAAADLVANVEASGPQLVAAAVAAARQEWEQN